MSKNYYICTVVNDVYLNFLYYFTKSALEKCKNLKKLYVLYTGENFSKDPIYSDDRVCIIKHDSVIHTKNIWDDGWIKNVNLKSSFLKKLANEHDEPIFLIDVDSYFISDFISDIDMSCDLVICSRNHPKPYIASFIGLINTKKSIDFIDVWRQNIEKIKDVPKETNALINTIKEIKNNYKIQELVDDKISCSHSFENPPTETKILHFKGGNIGNAQELLNKRLEKLKSII